MHSRLMIAGLAAAFAATFAAPVAAEPTTAPAQEVARPADQADDRRAEVLLASSDIRTPGEQSDGQAAPPKRKRAARVTTCRCGGDAAPQQP